MHFAVAKADYVVVSVSQCAPFSLICAAFIIYYKTPKMVVEWRARKCCIWICFLCLALRAINCEFGRWIRQLDCIQYCRRSDWKRYRKLIFFIQEKRLDSIFKFAVEQHWKWSINRHHWNIIMIHMSFFSYWTLVQRSDSTMRCDDIASHVVIFHMRFASQRLNESRASTIRDCSFFSISWTRNSTACQNNNIKGVATDAGP